MILRMKGFVLIVFLISPFEICCVSYINFFHFILYYINEVHRLTFLWIKLSAGLYLLVGTGFQVLFHSPFGVLFTFPSRYYFPIGHWVVFSLRRWASLVPTGLHVSDGTLSRKFTWDFAYRTVTLYGSTFQKIPLSLINFGPDLGCSPFARRYLGNRGFFLFVAVLRCFSSRTIASCSYFIHCKILEGCSSGFPHSEISGSMAICASPKHFGACPVLRRLPVPRHSPCALSCLTRYLFYCSFGFLGAIVIA